MKTYKQLTTVEKELVNLILSEAVILVEAHAVGREFIRINMYEDAIQELKENGKTDLGICGAHFFSNSQWDDIEKDNQIEIFNFYQDMKEWVDGPGAWTDSDRGQEWLQNADEVITQNLINYFYND